MMEKDTTRKLLQYFSINCVCYDEMLLSYYQSVVEGKDMMVNTEEIVRELNKNISKLNLGIKRCRSEVDGSWYYGIVNEYPTQSNELNTQLTPQSLQIFHYIIKQLIYFDGYLRKSTLKELDASEIRDCSNEMFQYYLNELVLHSYLKPYEDGYTLGDKALLDLKSTLNQIFGDNVNTCELCKDIVVLNVKCSQCGKRMHKYCCERINKPGNSFCSSCVGAEMKIEG